MQRCFLDIDGVLADFTMGVHRKLGIDLSYEAWPYSKGPAGWDWNLQLGMSFGQLSDVCDFDLWTSLPWTSDGRDILRTVLRYFDQDDITLLTTPMPHLMSASGKIAWVHEHLPEYDKRLMVITDSKSILAQVPGAVLVDDNQGNCDKWREMGGKAVLVPRWWNSAWPEYAAGMAVTDVREQIEKGDEWRHRD